MDTKPRLPRRKLALAAALAVLGTACPRAAAPPDIRPAVATDQVSQDPDDPAIWVHPTDPSRSLVLGTNKVAAPAGSLVVFDLEGKARQTVAGLDRPNNVDVEYGLPLGGVPTDIAVLTERLRSRLRVYRVTADGVTDISAGEGIPVFAGQQGEAAAPMGIALYRRPRDGAIFAIVGRKTGPGEGYLWQYRLSDDGTGKVQGTKVREFGSFSGAAEIEAIAVDDELGYVYYADENRGVRKWHADPDHPEAGRELAFFAREGFAGNQEGIAIYTRSGGAGYIVCTDQIPGNSRYHVFRREGAPGNPHDHSERLKVVSGGADSTDGLEVTSAALGPRFPGGLLIAMNSSGRNFLFFRWEDVAEFGPVKLLAGPK